MAVQSKSDSALDQGGPQASGNDMLVVRLISALFIILGIGAIAALLFNVFTSPDLAALTAENDTGDYILVFLNTFGIIIPLLLIGFGIYFIQIGVRVGSRDYTAASWAQLVLFWLMIFAAFYITFLIIQRIPGVSPEGSVGAIPWLNVVLAIGIALVSYVAWSWLNGNKVRLFVGDDTLSDRDARLAWTLLIPTLAVLIFIAARPLERTFVASLTDQTFAGTEAPEFVGFANYAELLSLRIDRIECERAEDGACLIEENRRGELETVFPRARDVLPERYSELRFRDVSTWRVGDNQWVLSARDEDFIEAFQNTIFFTVVAVLIELVLGMIVALTVNSKFPGRGAMRAAMLVPWAIPTVVSARLWEVMLRDNRSGVINDMLIRMNVIDSPMAWLANPDLQIWSLIFVDVWKTTPFFALLLLAGLQTIPGDIYEAADVDGASRIRKFFSITLPLLRPTIAVALIFRTLDSLRVFDVFDVLLGKQVQSMSTYNQQVLIENQDFGYASAVGVTIFVMILIFTIIYVRALGIED